MDQGKRLALNTVCNVAGLVTNVILGIVLAPFILRHLGKTTYGVWALVGSSLAYATLLSLGLNSAVNRWIPIYLVQKDHEGINRVVNTTIFAYVIASGILVIAIVILAIGFPAWFGVPAELHTASRWTVCLIGAGYIALVGLNASAGVLSGVQRYDLMTFTDVVSDIVRAIGIVAAFLCGYGLVSLAAISGVAIIGRSVLKAVYARRCCPEYRLNLSLACWRTFRDMLGYSINTFLVACGQVIQQQAALILIGVILSTAAVSVYHMPLLIISVVARLVLTGSAAMKPVVSKLDAEQRLDHVRKLYLMGTKYALLIVLPIGAFLLLYGDAVMRIWLGDEYDRACSVILGILTIAAMFQLWHRPAIMVGVGLGKHRMFGVTTLAMAAASVLLGVVFGKWLQMGVIGVALGFAVPEAAISIFPLTAYCCRSAGVTIKEEIAGSILPAFVATSPALAVMIIVRCFHRPEALGELMILLGMLAVPTIAGWWWWGFAREERARFAAMIPIGRFTARGAGRQ